MRSQVSKVICPEVSGSRCVLTWFRITVVGLDSLTIIDL